MSSCYPPALSGASIQNINIGGNGPIPSGGCSKCTFGLATAVQYYGISTIAQGSTTATVKPTVIDDPQSSTSSTLGNRVGIEFFNDGAVEVEISQNSQGWTYGDHSARKIAPGASWFLSIGPSQVVGKHYVLGAAAGATLHLTETGA